MRKSPPLTPFCASRETYNYIINSGYKPHQCPACKKTFARGDALKRHLKSLPGEVGGVCPQKARLIQVMQMAAGSGSGSKEGGAPIVR
jgi:hypothetical protein